MKLIMHCLSGLALVAAYGCGGGQEPAHSPASAPPAPKSSFTSLAVAANSGKVDKVGNKDGALSPDGVQDTVFDAVIDGPATAFVLVSTDVAGRPTGVFIADTFVGAQALPAEASAGVQQGTATGGIAVYEGEKLLNGKDGSVAPLGAGPHKLTFYVSSPDAPKGGFKGLVVFADGSVVASPVAF